jgi:TPR repeat protein
VIGHRRPATPWRVARRWGAAAALLLAASGCAEPGRSGFGPMVEVCDAQGCRLQPSAAGSPDLARDGVGRRQENPCVFRGESLAALREAAAAGDALATCRLGDAQERGAGGLAPSPAAAARSFEAAAQAGQPFAQFRLAQLTGRGAAPGGRGRAMDLMRAAAEGGVGEAQLALGLAALNGRGVARDPTEAARWLTLAAENGLPEAQYALARLLFSGAGVPREPFAAVRWMRQAAQNGYLPAQRAAGRLFMTGLEEMGADLNEAQTWLSAAAAQGDAEARRWLREVEAARAAEAAQRRAFEQQLALQAEQTRAFWYGMLWWNSLAQPYFFYRW